MYKSLRAIIHKFISLHELRTTSLLGMVLSSLTDNVFFNVLAATFLAVVHLPLLLYQDKNRFATLGSASLVTGGLAKITVFTIPIGAISLFFTATILTLSSLAPTLGNLIFSLFKLRDVLLNRTNNRIKARDTFLAIALTFATLLMSLPLWAPHLHTLAMFCKTFIILTSIPALALMLSLRYEPALANPKK